MLLVILFPNSGEKFKMLTTVIIGDNEIVDVSNANIADLVKAIYRHSKPQEMDFIHFQPGELEDTAVNGLIRPNERSMVYVDYAKGRACKFSINQIDGKRYIHLQIGMITLGAI